MNNLILSKLPDDVILGHFISIQENVTVGHQTRISNYVNLYGCTIGANCMIGAYVEVQSAAAVGDGSRISSHSFVCSQTTIGEQCFIGHGVMFINDAMKNHRVNFDPEDWKPIQVGNDVIIGSNATVFPVNIGNHALVGAGSVVLHDVPENAIVAGNPARIIRYRN